MTFSHLKRRLAFTIVLLLGIGLIGGLCYVLSPDVRLGAVAVFEAMGADEALAARADDVDKDVQQEAIDALTRRGAAGVPAVVNRLSRPDASERMTAAAVLGRIGPPAKDALPALQVLAHEDSEPYVRSEAIVAIALIGRGDLLAITEIERLLKSPVEQDRLSAAFACRLIEADAKPAVPALLEALHDPDGDVAEEAAKAISAIVAGFEGQDRALRDRLLAQVRKAEIELGEAEEDPEH